MVRSAAQFVAPCNYPIYFRKKNMKLLIALVGILCISATTFAQQPTIDSTRKKLPLRPINPRNKTYRSIEETKIANPDSVFRLDVSRKSLTEFPQEILNFPNLEILSLDNNKIKQLKLQQRNKKMIKAKKHHNLN